jgi:hypothetical protein
VSRTAAQAMHDAAVDAHRKRAQEFEDWSAMRVRLTCLAQNLRTVGALTYSWDLGWARGEAATDPHVSIEEWRAKWQPNLDGKAAP